MAGCVPGLATWKASGQGVEHLAQAGEVPVAVRGAGVVGGDGEVGRPEVTPAAGVSTPTVGVAAGVLGLGLYGEAVHGEPGRLAVGPDGVEGAAGLVVGADDRHPAVAQEGTPLDDHRRRAAEPDRDRLRRARVDAGPLDGVELPGEVHG